MRVLRLDALGPRLPGALAVDFAPLLAGGSFLELPETWPPGVLLDAACHALFGETEGIERVALEMGLGDDRYLVERVGSGARLVKAGVSSGFDDGEVVAMGAREVTEEIEILLGWDEVAFRSAFLLPQAAFGEMLGSPLERRTELLESLLQREVHRRIDQELGQAASQHAATEGGDPRDVILNLITALLAPERTTPYTFPELSAERQLLDARLEASGIAAARLRAATVRAEGLFDEGRRRLDVQQELAEAEAVAAELERKRPSIEAQRHLARRASGLTGLQRTLAEALAHVEACDRKVEAAEAQARGALEEARRARTRVVAERERDAEREAARREVQLAEEAAASAAVLEEAREAWKRAGDALEEALSRRDEAGERLVAAQRRLVEEEQVKPPEAADPHEVERLTVTLANSSALLDRVRRVDMLRVELREAAKTQGRSKTRAKVVADALDRMRRDALRRAALPASMRQPPEPGPSEAELQAELRGHEAEEAWQADVIVRVRTELRELMDDLGPLLYSDAARLEAAVNEARAALERLSAGEARVMESAANVRALREEVPRLRDELEAREHEARRATALRDAASVRLAELERIVPERFRARGAASEAARRSAEKLAALELALSEASAAATRGNDLLAAREDQVRVAREAARAARHRVEELQASLTRQLGDRALTSSDDVLAASLDPGELARIEEEVRRFDDAWGPAQERLRRAREGRQLPRADVRQLEQLVAQVRDACAQAEHEEAELSERLARLDDLDDLAVQLSEIGEVWEVVRRIAEVARGKNPVGLAFQRFVLTALLDDVLETASRRLRRMTRGRFYLQRAATDGPARRGELDLELHDAVTGLIRRTPQLGDDDVFLSSLALAVGLADVVQASSGGVRLDTLLIEDGIGRLDDEAFESAVEALTEMRRSGRVVGVVTSDASVRTRLAHALAPGGRGGGAG